MAGVAFAAFLVALTMSPQTERETALDCFAAAMPLIIGSEFLKSLGKRTEIPIARKMILQLAPLILIFGAIVAAVGIYWLFRCASAKAAHTFLQFALGLFVGLPLLNGAIKIVQDERRRKKKAMEGDAPSSPP
jgi:undecaprenyl pyrophosphate phosphatase UppP